MASLTSTRVAPAGVRAPSTKTVSTPRLAVAPRTFTTGAERRAVRSIVRAQDGEGTAGKVTDKSSAGPAQLPQTGRESPFGENKKAHTPELGAAPEGDKAIIGQKAQPMGQKAYSETPEERYGSAEKAEAAMEASKDRTRKSELQTNDMDAQSPGGVGGSGEGSSA